MSQFQVTEIACLILLDVKLHLSEREDISYSSAKQVTNKVTTKN